MNKPAGSRLSRRGPCGDGQFREMPLHRHVRHNRGVVVHQLSTASHLLNSRRQPTPTKIFSNLGKWVGIVPRDLANMDRTGAQLTADEPAFPQQSRALED